MKEILEKVKMFETRNNISVVFNTCSDGSGELREFWDDDLLYSYESIYNLILYLDTVKYQKSENGTSFKPVRIICNYCGKTEVCKGQYPEGCILENDKQAINDITTHNHN